MVGLRCTNHVQDTLGDSMKLEDIKVGDVVTTTGIIYEGDYTVYSIQGELIILDVQEQTGSCWNVLDKDTLWAVQLENIVKVVDSEEDLIVWGALDAGEKFQIKEISSTTYLKLNDLYYVALGSSLLHRWKNQLHRKVLLVD